MPAGTAIMASIAMTSHALSRGLGGSPCIMQHWRRGLPPQWHRFYSHFPGCIERWVVFADVRVTVRERFDLVVTAERPGYRGSTHASRSHKLVAQAGDCHDQFGMLR